MEFPKTDEEFYELIGDKMKLKQFIIEQNLIEPTDRKCSNILCQDKPYFKLCYVRNNLQWRCHNTNCSRYFSARNDILKLEKNANLPINKILEIIWFWSFGINVKTTTEKTGLNKKTIIKWFAKIRIELLKNMENAEPMGGPGYRVQIDESLFRGRRKYNRGRLLLGDKKPIESIRDRLRSLVKTPKIVKKISNRNYGRRIEGPWVFGMVIEKIADIDQKRKTMLNNKNSNKNYIRENFKSKSKRHELYKDKRKINVKATRIYLRKQKYISKLSNCNKNENKEVRMFYVDRRDAKTLIPIIRKNILPGTEIVSDEWKAYKGLNKEGYIHYEVNHTENFVNPKNGMHSQLIECLWGVSKLRIVKNIRGTSKTKLPSHLAEFWFRSKHEKKGSVIFREILILFSKITLQ